MQEYSVVSVAMAFFGGGNIKLGENISKTLSEFLSLLIYWPLYNIEYSYIYK